MTESHSWRVDPAVPDFPDEYPLVVFDGECVLCSANAQFILRHDRKGRFRLTTAQGALGQALYRHLGLDADHYETMLLLENGRVRVESDAAIGIAEGLGWPWRAACLARLIPPISRDPLYRLIARNRFRLFGRRATCWRSTTNDTGRIL